MPCSIRKGGWRNASRFHSQQHPDTTESEDHVGKPGGDEGRQPVDAAELVEELKGRPVEDSDSEAESNPIERAFLPVVKENGMPMMAMINDTSGKDSFRYRS